MSDRSGLGVEASRGGWAVIHERSGLRIVPGTLRLRQYAEDARDELYATGADFTQDALGEMEVRGVACVAQKWDGRSRQQGADPVTGDRYGMQ